MGAAAVVAESRPGLQGAPPTRGAVDPQRDLSKKTSYRVSPIGIEITDLRQLTHGPIVPNSIVDLYLPIIGYDGLGILTALYRLATADGRVRTRTKLDTFARAGRLGFRRFSQLLKLLNDLSIIAVRKPTGAARSAHFHTEITLLDPPTAVPETLRDMVLDRTLTPWLIASTQADGLIMPDESDGQSCHPQIPELLPNNSSNCHLTILELSDSSSIGCTRQQNVPIGNEPIGGKQGRARIAAPRRAAAHSPQAPTRQADDEKHNQVMNQTSASLRDLWNQHAARPRQTDDTRLQQLSDEFGEPWVTAAIRSLGERAPIYKLDAVRVTLDRWQHENSWGSPAPKHKRRMEWSRKPLLAPNDPRHKHPVIARYCEILGTIPSGEQIDAMIAVVHDDKAWLETLQLWRLNGHRPHNITGLLDRYGQQRNNRSVGAGASPRAVPQAIKKATLVTECTEGVPDSVWGHVQQALAARVATEDFEAWLRATTLLHIDETEAIVAAGNVFARDALQAYHQSDLEVAIASVVGRHVAVRVVIS